MKYFKYLFFTTIAFCLVFFIATGIFWIKKTNKINKPTKQIAPQETNLEMITKKESETIKIGGVEFEAEILDEESERVRGLSGRTSLEKDKVMLFLFEEETYPGIWMKDMAFPIDIAWVDKTGSIVHIEKDVSPNTFPKVFFPPTKSLYVLETNAGFFESHGIGAWYLVEVE